MLVAGSAMNLSGPGEVASKPQTGASRAPRSTAQARSALEPDHIPEQRVMSVPGGQPLSGQDVHHGPRRMHEGAEVVALQASQRVVPPQRQSGYPIVRWVGKDQQPPGMAASSGKQPFVIRVTAHDPVQHHHVGRLDVVGSSSDVEKPAGHSSSHPLVLEQKESLRFVVGGDLQVRGRGRSSAQELDLNLAYSPADLLGRGALDPAFGEEPDQPLLGARQAVLAEPPPHPVREPVTERGLISVSTAASTHSPSIGLSG